MDEITTPDAALGRRDLIVRLAGIALSVSGLSAFRRVAPLAQRLAAPK